MKKHPVDDLFKHRLSDLEKKPSSEAWQKIQQRSGVQRRPLLGWVWYAAASVMIAGIAGYLVWQNDSNRLIRPNNLGKVIASIENKKSAIPESKVHENNVKDQVAVAEEKKQTDRIESVGSTSRKEGLNKEVKIQPENKSNIRIEHQSVAFLEKRNVAENEPQDIQETPSTPVKVEDVKILPDVSAVSQVTKQDTEPTRTIVVAVETSSEEVDDKPRSSRFSRVFRQLKNARAGERVDWEEVGFNPKTLVAKVDDRLHSRDEKVSDKYQNPKERTKL